MIPSVHTYIGEIGSIMDDERKERGKKPLKHVLYIAFSFILNGGFVVAFGKCVLVLSGVELHVQVV